MFILESVGSQVNTNTSTFISRLRETLSLSLQPSRVYERESDTVGKFVGIKVDCKDSKFANKISPLCKNKIKLFQISCLTKPDPPSIFSITEFLLRDNFLPELSLSLKRIKVLVGSVIWHHNHQPGATTYKSDIGPRTKGTFIKWSASVLTLIGDIL